MDIEIINPVNDSLSYFNRKHRYAVELQEICDSDKKIINVFVGKPVACHDAAMWRDSSIYEKLQSDEIRIPESYHLIGDTAYPLDINLMKPYRDNGFLTQI